MGMDIKLEGISADKLAALKVKYGKWTAQNINASKNALIEVGTEPAPEGISAPQYGEGAPSLTASNVSIESGSKILVHEQGSIDLAGLNMKGGEVKAQGAANINDLVIAAGTVDASGPFTTRNMTMNSGSVTVENDMSIHEKAQLKSGDVKVGGSLTAASVSVDGANVTIESGTGNSTSTINDFNMTAGKLTLNWQTGCW